MNTPTGYSALDLVGFTPKGDYSGSATYVQNDIVRYNNNLWRCKLDDTSAQTPAEGTYWTLFIEGSTLLSSMTDTAISSPANGDVLEYDSTSGKWKNSDVIGEVKQALSDEVVTRATLGGHNLLDFDLDLLKELNHGSGATWSGNTYTWRGVTYTINNDKTVTVVTDGTTTQSSQLSLMRNGSVNTARLVGKDVILSGCPSGGSSNTYAMSYKGQKVDTGNGVSISNFEADGQITIGVTSGTNIPNPITFRPMIRLATDADETFRPYVPTNAELLSYKDNGVLGAKNLLDATVLTWTSTAGENKSQTIGEIYLKAGTSIVFTVKQETSMTSNTRNTIIVTPKGQSANAVVEDNTANYMLSAGTHKMTYTAPAEHTYVFSIWCHTPNVAITYSDFMVRLATDTDPTYQPYAMTNRELTEKVNKLNAYDTLSSTDTAVDSNGKYTLGIPSDEYAKYSDLIIKGYNGSNTGGNRFIFVMPTEVASGDIDMPFAVASVVGKVTCNFGATANTLSVLFKNGSNVALTTIHVTTVIGRG